MSQLHDEVVQAEAAIREFFRSNPDLADPQVHARYLPIKTRLDEALTSLGAAHQKIDSVKNRLLK